MIDFISGNIADKKPTQVVLESAGLGYLLLISTNTFKDLPDVGAPATLKTYLHVREDNLQLFGFSQENERSVFTGLISVSGIGPRLAQTILSGIQLDELIQSIQNGDLARLTSISGVGPKTAQRLIIELKEKFSQIGLIKDKLGDEVALPVLNSIEEEAVLALISLGYKRFVVAKALMKARTSGQNETVEELIKRTLQVI
jgi:Holliday junction DNA helicase RuvA